MVRYQAAYQSFCFFSFIVVSYINFSWIDTYNIKEYPIPVAVSRGPWFFVLQKNGFHV